MQRHRNSVEIPRASSGNSIPFSSVVLFVLAFFGVTGHLPMSLYGFIGGLKEFVGKFQSNISQQQTANGYMKPQMIRMDNSPEYISDCLRQWAEDHIIVIRHIEPGKPQQNAYVERYNRTGRHEWLSQYMFTTIEEVQDFATDWLWTYNNDRLNIGPDGISPVQKLITI